MVALGSRHSRVLESSGWPTEQETSPIAAAAGRHIANALEAPHSRHARYAGGA